MFDGKVCLCCKVEKPLTDFTRQKYAHKGVVIWKHKAWCKPCRSKKNTKDRLANVDKARAAEANNRRKRKENMPPEAKEKQREWVRAWAKANNTRIKQNALKHRDKTIARKREHYQEVREERLVKCKEYYINNKEKIKEKYKEYMAQPEVQARRRAYLDANLERERLRMREKIRNLDDNYVRNIIRVNTGLHQRLQSRPLIEAQKLIIQIKREIRK
jgi:hypothetical protein